MVFPFPSKHNEKRSDRDKCTDAAFSMKREDERWVAKSEEKTTNRGIATIYDLQSSDTPVPPSITVREVIATTRLNARSESITALFVSLFMLCLAVFIHRFLAFTYPSLRFLHTHAPVRKS